MLCKKPFKGFGCGQCMFCRFNKVRQKVTRLMLEASLHEKTSFVTLTYADEHLPKNGSLCPDDLKRFWMRLRSRVSPLRIRYYAVGEYGGSRFGNPDSTRDIHPHYHIALYGLDFTDSEIIKNAWGLGNVDVKFLEPASAMYISKYVNKKMTGKDDARLRLDNGEYLHPEFARMSLKPGIGADAMKHYAKVYENPYALAVLDQKGDVPTQIKFGDKTMPIDRYLRTQLRKHIGFVNINAQEGWALEKSLLDMQTFKEIEIKAQKQEVDPYELKRNIRDMKRQVIEEKLKARERKKIL